jgi:alpha-L-arabinofuranosidase
VYGTPQFYAIKMYNDHLGEDRLHAEVTSPEIQPGTQTVDAVATRTTDGTKIFVKFSNADRTHPLKVSLDLGSFHFVPNVSVSVLSSSNPMSRNSFTLPETIVPSNKVVRCKGTCNIELPPDSVAVATFAKEGR